MPRQRQLMEVDDKALKELRKQLNNLPQKLRGKPVITALKKSMNPTKRATSQAAVTMLNSPTVKRSFHVVTGKYAKANKTAPYVVLKFRDKTFPTVRRNDGFSSRHKTNWSKIGHFIGGTTAGIRTAGTSIRQDRAGRRRIKVFDKDGSPRFSRKGTPGRFFVVASAGRVHPIKKINHPGARDYPVYDLGAQQAGPVTMKDFLVFARKRIREVQKQIQ